MRHPGLSIALALAALAACDAYDDDLGPTPFLCGPTEPRCPVGYSCAEDPATGREICVGAGGSISDDFTCHDDSAYEPNDTLPMATTTPVDQMKTYQLGNLAICPAGDKDAFALTISASSSSLAVTVEFQAGGAELRAAILNTGGVPIATAQPIDGSPHTLRAYAQNLPTGTYYAQVSAAAAGATARNNYTLGLEVTPP
jgi:hypothetical protein